MHFTKNSYVCMYVCMCCRCWLSRGTDGHQSTPAVARIHRVIVEQFMDIVTGAAERRENPESIFAWNEIVERRHCFTAGHLRHPRIACQFDDSVDGETLNVYPHMPTYDIHALLVSLMTLWTVRLSTYIHTCPPTTFTHCLSV